MEKIRVLIADDHPFYREGVRTMLRATPDIEIIGEAANGEDTVAQAERLQPDVILMDLKMPGMGGIEATRRILHTSPHIGVLVLTMFEADETVFAAMRAGARGYLLKDADQDELIRAIRSNLPRAHRPRAGDPPFDRPGPQQHGDRRPALSQPQNGAQPRLEHLQ